MQRSEITFNKGAILRKEMLTDLYEYPRVALEGYYASFTDGILYGLQWCENEEKPGYHVIMPGALKFRGNIYFLSYKIEVEELLNKLELDGKYRLFFVEKDVVKQEPSRSIYEMELVAVQSNELEEAKKKGFYYIYIECRSNHKFVMIEDTKEVFGLFAANDGFKFKLPDYLVNRELKEILEKKAEKHPLDFLFLKEIYSGEGVSVSMAKLYLNEYYSAELNNKDCIDDIVNNPIKLIEHLKIVCSKLKSKVVVINKDNVPNSNYINTIKVKSQGSL